MRVLATIALSFTAGIFLISFLPQSWWMLYFAVVLALAGGIFLLLRRRKRSFLRLSLMAFSLAFSVAFFTLFAQLVQQPVLRNCGQELPFSATVCDYPVEAQYGAKVTVRLNGYRHAKAVYYGDESIMELVPGNTVTGIAQWNDASTIRETELTVFTSRGVYALLYDRGELTVGEGSAGSLRWWPQRVNRAFIGKIHAVWEDDRIAGIVAGMLSGETDGITDEDYTVMRGAGLAHLFAVSGLHCAFLVTLLALVLPRHRRRIFCGVTIVVLLFYMCMVGLSPSVVRACIMQIFLLIAPLFRRDSDGVTALSVALMVILLCNPFAIHSVSLQLSFAATFGIVLLSGRLYEFFTKPAEHWGDKMRRVWSFLCAGVSVTLGAMIFTTPLVAYHFNTLSLVSPLSGILALPIAGYGFMTSFVTTLLSFLWLPLAKVVGWVSFGLLYAVVYIAYLLTRWPYHAVYFSNPLLRIWLVGTYLGFILCYVVKRWRKRKYLIATAASALVLILSIFINSLDYRAGDINVTALDVGQGESVVLYSKGDAMLVDCGSSNSYIDAGNYAVDRLNSMGFRRLKAVTLTHFHADHANGLAVLLSTVKVDTLYVPDIEDEYGVREELEIIAQRHGVKVKTVTRESLCALGEAMVTLYPPVGAGDMNEQGLTVLATAGDFDVLITGDMKDSTERKLVEQYALPDVEVLLVGHHGSKYSSHEDFLAAVKPEIAIISVGDNSYGHPTAEAIGRLEAVGAVVRRTDEEGDITIYGGEEDGR